MESKLVWAERFKFTELLSQKDGRYNQQGSRKSFGALLVDRAYAVSRNAEKNNEIYVFDEEKTAELMLIRDENIKKQAEEAEKKTKSTEQVLAEAIVKVSNTSAPVDEELEELIEEAEGLGIVLKGRKTVKSVQKKIDEFKANN